MRKFEFVDERAAKAFKQGLEVFPHSFVEKIEVKYQGPGQSWAVLIYEK